MVKSELEVVMEQIEGREEQEKVKKVCKIDNKKYHGGFTKNVRENRNLAENSYYKVISQVITALFIHPL